MNKKMSFFRVCRQGLTALPVFFMFTACNHWTGFPTEAEKGSGKRVSVKIGAINVAGGSQTEITTRDSGGERRIVGEPVVQDLGDGMLAEITVEEDVEALRDAAPQPLTSGRKFRVIAIDATTKKLYSYADYTVPAVQSGDGEIDPDEGFELHVLGDNSYDFICVSYNSTDLPDDEDYEEGEELPPLSASVSKDIFYWRQEVPTVGSNLSLGIVLRPQFVKVKLKLDGNGKTIANIADNSIRLDVATSGNFNLAEGSFSGSGSINFSGWTPAELGDEEVTSNEFTFLPKASDYMLTFHARALTWGDNELPTAAKSNFISAEKFERGKIYTLTVKLKELAPSQSFAGSNIYWDGQKLTFDEQVSGNNTRYQGVFFKWGSLIGVAAGANEEAFSSGTATNYGLDDGTPIYMKDPDGNWVKTNVAYATSEGNGKERWFGNSPVANNVEGETAWAAIPYQDNASISADGDAHSLLTTNDFANYKGDICNYLKPGYRMPTKNELDALGIGNSGESDYTWTEDPSAVPTTPAANGTTEFSRYGTFFGLQSTTGIIYYLPASGYRGYSSGMLYRMGDDGYYWSGSASTTSYAHELDFYSGSAATSSAGRSLGQSVRCVKN